MTCRQNINQAGKRQFILRDEQIRQNAARFINELPINDQPFTVTVERYKKRRSVEANNRYWAILTFIAAEAYRLKITDKYYEPEYFHEHFKREFLGKRVVINGDILILPESTANKSTTEFSDFVTQVEAWAAQNGILIPNEEFI